MSDPSTKASDPHASPFDLVKVDLSPLPLGDDGKTPDYAAEQFHDAFEHLAEQLTKLPDTADRERAIRKTAQARNAAVEAITAANAAAKKSYDEELAKAATQPAPDAHAHAHQ
jgi:hypothetical protein